MTMGVFDFKSIRRNVERLEQKVEFEAKNPAPVESAPVVWTPDWGYGTAVPLAPLPGTANLPPYRLNLQATVKDAEDARLQFYQMYGLGYQGDSGDETGC